MFRAPRLLHAAGRCRFCVAVRRSEIYPRLSFMSARPRLGLVCCRLRSTSAEPATLFSPHTAGPSWRVPTSGKTLRRSTAPATVAMQQIPNFLTFDIEEWYRVNYHGADPRTLSCAEGWME